MQKIDIRDYIKDNITVLGTESLCLYIEKIYFKENHRLSNP